MERYKNYAATLKVKFEDYEKESEKYYADLLEKFKAQARAVCLQKDKEIADWTERQRVKEEKI